MKRLFLPVKVLSTQEIKLSHLPEKSRTKSEMLVTKLGMMAQKSTKIIIIKILIPKILILKIIY